MIVVSDAGPLIALSRIGKIGILRELFGNVIIPQAVWNEVVASGKGRPGQAEVESSGWIRLWNVSSRTSSELLRERLGAGESEAIVLALESGADLVLMDESRGRSVADAQGLKRIGTIGILILAKKRGLLVAVAPLLFELKKNGFHIDDALFFDACALSGETEDI